MTSKSVAATGTTWPSASAGEMQAATITFDFDGRSADASMSLDTVPNLAEFLTYDSDQTLTFRNDSSHTVTLTAGALHDISCATAGRTKTIRFTGSGRIVYAHGAGFGFSIDHANPATLKLEFAGTNAAAADFATATATDLVYLDSDWDGVASVPIELVFNANANATVTAVDFVTRDAGAIRKLQGLTLGANSGNLFVNRAGEINAASLTVASNQAVKGPVTFGAHQISGSMTIDVADHTTPIVVDGDSSGDSGFSNITVQAPTADTYKPMIHVQNRTTPLDIGSVPRGAKFLGVPVLWDDLDYSMQASDRILISTRADMHAFSLSEFGSFERKLTLSGDAFNSVVTNDYLTYNSIDAKAWSFQVVMAQSRALALESDKTVMQFDVDYITDAQFPAAGNATARADHSALFGPSNAKPTAAAADRSVTWQSSQRALIREFSVVFESTDVFLGNYKIVVSLTARDAVDGSVLGTYKFPVTFTATAAASAFGTNPHDTILVPKFKQLDETDLSTPSSISDKIVVKEAKHATVQFSTNIKTIYPFTLTWSNVVGSVGGIAAPWSNTLEQYPNEYAAATMDSENAKSYQFLYNEQATQQFETNLDFTADMTAAWAPQGTYGVLSGISTTISFRLNDNDDGIWTPSFISMNANGHTGDPVALFNIDGSSSSAGSYTADRGFAVAPTFATNNTSPNVAWRHKASGMAAMQPTFATEWRMSGSSYSATPRARSDLTINVDVATSDLASKGWSVEDVFVVDRATALATHADKFNALYEATANGTRGLALASSGSAVTTGTIATSTAVKRTQFTWPADRDLNKSIGIVVRLKATGASGLDVSLATVQVPIYAYASHSDDPQDMSMLVNTPASMGGTDSARKVVARFTPQHDLLMIKYANTGDATGASLDTFAISGDATGHTSAGANTAGNYASFGAAQYSLDRDNDDHETIAFRARMIGVPSHAPKIQVGLLSGGSAVNGATNIAAVYTGNSANTLFTVTGAGLDATNGIEGANVYLSDFETNDNALVTFSGTQIPASLDDETVHVSLFVTSASTPSINGSTSYESPTTGDATPDVTSYKARNVKIVTTNDPTLQPAQYPASTAVISSADTTAKVRVSLNRNPGGTVRFEWVARFYSVNNDGSLTRVTDGVDGLVTFYDNAGTTVANYSEYDDSNETLFTGDHTKTIKFANTAWPSAISRVKIFLKGINTTPAGYSGDISLTNLSFYSGFNEEHEWYGSNSNPTPNLGRGNGLVAQYQVNIPAPVDSTAVTAVNALDVDEFYLNTSWRFIVVGTSLVMQQSVNGVWYTVQTLDITQNAGWVAESTVGSTFQSPDQAVHGTNSVYAATTALGNVKYSDARTWLSDHVVHMVLNDDGDLNAADQTIGSEYVMTLEDGRATIATLEALSGYNATFHMAPTDSSDFAGDESHTAGASAIADGKLYLVNRQDTATARPAKKHYPMGDYSAAPTISINALTSAAAAGATFVTAKAGIVGIWTSSNASDLTLTTNGQVYALTSPNVITVVGGDTLYHHLTSVAVPAGEFTIAGTGNVFKQAQAHGGAQAVIYEVEY
jgi:hypothetical protein